MFQSTTLPYNSNNSKTSSNKIIPNPFPDKILTPEKGLTKIGKTSPSPKPRRTESASKIEKYSSLSAKYQSNNQFEPSDFDDLENLITENEEMTPSKTNLHVSKIFTCSPQLSSHRKGMSTGNLDKMANISKSIINELKFLDTLPQKKDANRIKSELYRLKFENQRLIQQRGFIAKHYENELTELRETFQNELAKIETEKVYSIFRRTEDSNILDYQKRLEEKLKLKETSLQKSENKLEKTLRINEKFEEQVKGLMSMVESQQIHIDNLQKSGSYNERDNEINKISSNLIDLKVDLKKIEQDIIEEREKLKLYSSKMSSDKTKGDNNKKRYEELMLDNERLTNELHELRQENLNLSNIIKSHLLSSQKSLKLKENTIRELKIELEQFREKNKTQATQISNNLINPRFTFSDERTSPNQVSSLMSKEIKNVLLMIEVERLHSVIRELTGKLQEQENSFERDYVLRDSIRCTEDKIASKIQKESDSISEKSYQEFEKPNSKSQLDRLAEEFRKSELKSYFIIESARTDNDTSSYISERRGSIAASSPRNQDQPKFTEEKPPESAAKLQSEMEKLNELLIFSNNQVEKSKKEKKELELSQKIQIEDIEKTIETFVKNKIIEELKQYEASWLQEKENKDRTIENQKSLITKLKEKINVLTQDLKELTQIKVRESTLLSRIEKKGTELNNDFLSERNT